MPAAAEMPAPPPPPPLLLLLLLACCAGTCPGAPVLSQGLQPEQEPQLWNEIRDACSAFLSLDSQPQAPNALKELCITIMGTLPKPQETDEKDNTKRFLFHYSKTRKLGNSNVVDLYKYWCLQVTKRKTTQNRDVPQDCARRIPRSYRKPSSKTVFVQGDWKNYDYFHKFLKGKESTILEAPRNGRRSEGYI